ncbi:uncharacterized protein LOC106462475 [Limulus polyphemus]|uniref:Uncharacterized protein LOC106462475 n=1 Tax=Limulus polyphemus TaxID=6850 RepID=A0ABM1BA19_LIMPO|nr:uncharacterized protein LOC106462475 [Limulus polyphemus]XP_022245460.1 uncharacterized protein LOC106462475 [Limulus polyphemus]
MSLAGRVIMTVTATLCAFLGPMAGNVIPNSGYVPLEGRVSNIYRESTPKQITYYPYKALQVDKNASPGNSYPQYSYMMVRPSLQRNTFKTNDLRKPHKKENYIGTDDGISHQWKLLPRSNSISTIKSGNFWKDHVVQHTSMKVYPSKRVSDVEQEEYLDKTGVLGKNIDQASSQHEKLAYLSPKVSQLQKDEFYIQHKSKESSKPHAMSHHHPILKQNAKSSVNDVYFVAIVAGCTAAAIFGVIASGICFYRFKKKARQLVMWNTQHME